MLCYNTLNKWIREGKLTLVFVNPSGRRYFTRKQIEAYFSMIYDKKKYDDYCTEAMDCFDHHRPIPQEIIDYLLKVKAIKEAQEKSQKL